PPGPAQFPAASARASCREKSRPCDGAPCRLCSRCSCPLLRRDGFAFDCGRRKIASACNLGYNDSIARRPPVKAEVRSSQPMSDTKEALWRRSLGVPLIVLGVAAALVFTWYYAPSLLLLFAGILFAALLDACTRGLARVIPLSRSWRFAL